MGLFFTSDTHFGHKFILTAGEGRPFASIEEHDEALVENWNSVVGPDDTVVHLGDVVMGTRTENLQIIKRLNGTKILIPGNHDYVSAVEKESRRERYMPIYGEVFDRILPDIVIIGSVAISHYPPAEIPDHGEEDRYPHMRPPSYSNTILFIHGHTHQTDTITYLPGGRMAVSVGVDANDWRPVPIEELPLPEQEIEAIEYYMQPIGVS